MKVGRKPIGKVAMTNAERQAKFAAKHKVLKPRLETAEEKAVREAAENAAYVEEIYEE